MKVLCPGSGSHRKVKQNGNLRPVQDCGSLAVFRVTARDQGKYKGPSGAFVTYCNISCYTPGIRSMPWGYNVFVFSLCVCVCVSVNNFGVRSITLKPLDIFS